MLGYCKDILDLNPYEEKFRAFNWDVVTVDGHNTDRLRRSLVEFKNKKGNKPKMLIANTIKGKGVPRLESDPLSHIKRLDPDEFIDGILKRL
jgi:transketolase